LEEEMYAIFRTGGKQYKAEVGDILKVEKLPHAVGDKLEFDDVLLVSSDDGLLIPNREGKKVRVRGTVTGQGKGPKVIVFKYKPKKGYHRKKGHRQLFTEVRVDEILVPGKERKGGSQGQKEEPVSQE